MRTMKTVVIALWGACMLAGTMAGCESTQGTQKSSGASAAPQPARAPEASSPARGWPSHRNDRTMAWSSIALPTGNAATSALGLEKGVPQEVWVNQTFEYQIVATNLTGFDLEDVLVSDAPGANLKINSATPAAQSGAGNHMTWPLGTLKPGESKTVKVNATATSAGQVGSCATASYSAELCSIIPVVSPQLKLVKTGPAEVIRCDDILYRFQVTNTGTGSVHDVKITDPLPDGLTTRDNKNAIVLEVGELKAGETRPMTAVVKAARTGRFEAKATATGTGGLSAASEAVVTTVRQPVLSLTKKCPDKQYMGRALDYSITVTNTGDGVARDTVIEDTIPRGTSFVSATDGGRPGGGRVVWDLGELQPNASKTVTMKLMPDGAAGVLRNTATAKASCAADATASCEHEVTGIPAILLEVVDVEDPVQVGGNTTYVITVTNQGTSPGTNIRVVSRLEENQQFVSATGATDGTASNRTITFAPIASLAPKQKATFRVTVRNVRPGDVRFQVSMTSDQLTRTVEETEATFVYE